MKECKSNLKFSVQRKSYVVVMCGRNETQPEEIEKMLRRFLYPLAETVRPPASRTRIYGWSKNSQYIIFLSWHLLVYFVRNGTGPLLSVFQNLSASGCPSDLASHGDFILSRSYTDQDGTPNCFVKPPWSWAGCQALKAKILSRKLRVLEFF